MMDFNTAVAKVLRLEGGYSNDKTDRGGATNYGISTRANPDVDVKNLTKQGAIDLYKSRYWDALGIDKLPDNLKLIAFDSAVNHGVGATRRMLGESNKDPNSFLQLRENLYSKIIEKDPSQAKFQNGWANRLASVAGEVNKNATPAGGAAPNKSAPGYNFAAPDTTSIAASQPQAQPTAQPQAQPTAQPQAQPTAQPTAQQYAAIMEGMGLKEAAQKHMAEAVAELAPTEKNAFASLSGALVDGFGGPVASDQLDYSGYQAQEAQKLKIKESQDAVTFAFGGKVKNEEPYAKWLTDMVTSEMSNV